MVTMVTVDDYLVTVDGHHSYSRWSPLLQEMVTMVKVDGYHGYSRWLPWLQEMVTIVTGDGHHG